jgi:uncharacterized protein
MPHGSSEQDRRSLLSDALCAATRAVSRRPLLTLWIVAAVSCAAVLWTLARINFKTDRSDLIDPNADFQRRWTDYTDRFGGESDIVVVVEADRRETIVRVLEEIGNGMEREPELFQGVLYKIDTGRVPAHKGLQYLPPADLEAGLQTLGRLRPYLQRNGDGLAMDAVFTRLARDLDTLKAEGGRRKAESGKRTDSVTLNSQLSTEREKTLQFAERFTSGMSSFLGDPSRFESPWPRILPARNALPAATPNPVGGPTYFLNKAGTMGFLKAFPARDHDSFDGASRAVDRLRELTAEVVGKYPHVRVGLTGIPVLENDEMRRSRADMSRATIISFIGVGLILILGFRGLRHPLLALAMLTVGMAWSFGYTTLFVGHLNILSISFAVILIGLGIDFAIHFLARYLELRHEGEALRPSLVKTAAGVGAGVTTAAVTTAFAFFSATFTQFLGVAELGIIAGGGILLCAAATFLVLPALVALSDRNVEPRKLPTPFQGSLLRKLTSRFPRPVAIASLVLIIGVASQVLTYEGGRFRLRVRYDYNLLNLQAEGVESVKTQRRVFRNSDHSLLYAVSIAKTPAEARELKRKLEALPTVDHVDELASALPAVPHEQTRLLIQAYRTMLADVADRAPRPPVREPAVIGRAIEQFYLRIRKLSDPAASRTARTIDGFLDRFERLPLERQRSFLAGFQQRIAAALHQQVHAIAGSTDPEPVTVADLPQALTMRFVGKGDRWLLQIYPKNQIWDVEPLQQFVADVRSVDPDVTGTPLQNFEAARQIKTSYKTASLYALAAILLVLLIDFQDRDYTLLTLLGPLMVIIFTIMALKTRRIQIDPTWLIAIYTVMALAIAAIFDFRNLRNALLAMVPPIAGGVMMFGVLGILHVNLNPANLIVLPLVLGIGVDDGVHVVHDFRMQPGRYRTSASTMNAIVLTSLTSMVGFGSMMVASHRGLYSVGLVLVVGLGSCLFVSLVALPALLTLISARDARESTATTLRFTPLPVDEAEHHPERQAA